MAKCHGHSNLQLILLGNLQLILLGNVINTVSMLQSDATNADVWQVIRSWYAESGVTATSTMNISFLAQI